MEESLITQSLPAIAKKQSLRHRLVSAANLILLLAVLSGAMGVLQFVYRTEQQARRARQHEAARSAANTVTSFMNQVQE